MPVFLSHKREDKEQTLVIAGYLKQNNVNCYVDVFDPELQTTDDITKKIDGEDWSMYTFDGSSFRIYRKIVVGSF